MKTIKGEAGARLDKFLSIKCDDLSRSQIQALIKSGKIRLNGASAKANNILKDDDVITLPIEEKVIQDLPKAEKELKINIVYEDSDCMVIDKPAGMVVHPAEGNTTGTVVNMIIPHLDKEMLDGARPGIVHRLDKDTSGALLVAKNLMAYENLVGQFKARKVKKEYMTMVYGVPHHNKGVIDSPIGRDLKERKKMSIVSEKSGKKAVSIYEVVSKYRLENGKMVSLLKVEIKTGRTHQIRVHLTAIGHPVVGDGVYGNRSINKTFRENFDLKRQFLHAQTLAFKSPATGKTVTVKVPLANDLQEILDKL